MYAIMTDDDGIVVNDPVLLKLAEDRYLVFDSGFRRLALG